MSSRYLRNGSHRADIALYSKGNGSISESPNRFMCANAHSSDAKLVFSDCGLDLDIVPHPIHSLMMEHEVASRKSYARTATDSRNHCSSVPTFSSQLSRVDLVAR